MNQELLTDSDFTLRKQIDDIQSFLLGFGWSGSGKNFFEALSEYLARILSADYVCIDRLIEGGLEAQTVAIHFDGHFENNEIYKLEDTPCGKVVGQKVCCFPTGVRHLFPLDKMLQDMVAESYAGITLWGSGGTPIGLIATVGRKPLEDPGLTETVLKQVSIRAACELEHIQMEAAILQSRDELEVLVGERTAELQKANELLTKEIIKRKQKEKSLTLAEEKYRTVADFTHDWETWLSPEGKFLYVSPSCLPTTGYTVEEFMDDPSLVFKITHPDDRDMVEKHYSEKLESSTNACSIDFRIITRDGEEKWIGHSCQPVFDSKGKWIGQRGSNRDITERKMTESVLIDSQIHLRALTQRMDAVAEEERTKIAREIHDELGHLLTSLKYDIEGLSNKTDLSAELLNCELAAMNRTVETLMNAVRKIATELRPGILDHLGLIPAIEWQIEQFRKKTNIKCEYDLPEINGKFDRQETTIIFRIVQEILTNIARHSRADKVSVSFSKKEDHYLFTAADNGIGFELIGSDNGNSLGLMGMRERALSIGAEFDIESAPGKGTMITLLLKKND